METWTDRPDIILNYSGVCYESGLADLCPGTCLIDFSSLEGTNCYVDPDSYASMRSTLMGNGHGGIHWIDTGDYHYATKLFLEKIEQPFALLLLDHHPDMQCPAFPVLSCGSWLRDSLDELPFLMHAAIVGIAGDLAGECEGFPGRTSVFAEQQSFNGIDDVAIERIASCIPEGLPLYISIDKDVFSEELARTDWDQGCMSLDFCQRLIEKSSCGRKILGIDICGAITISKGASDTDFSINNETDRKLLHFLREKMV